jgi:hypothetical protein
MYPGVGPAFAHHAVDAIDMLYETIQTFPRRPQLMTGNLKSRILQFALLQQNTALLKRASKCDGDGPPGFEFLVWAGDNISRQPGLLADREIRSWSVLISWL